MAEISRSEPVEEQSQASGEGAIYEIGFHLIPTLTEPEAVDAFGRIKSLLGENASLIAEQAPARISFAYRIERSVQGKREKYAEGYFGFVKFEAQKSAIPVMEAALRSDHAVLRSMLIHATKESEQPEQRAVFSSNRLEGEAITKPVVDEKRRGEVSQEELDKSLKTLVGE